MKKSYNKRGSNIICVFVVFVNIVRRKNYSYGKLSEGTKETVSLAFRLAVLDHLFPDGGSVIVLDDPFTDMDSERTNQACKLVKECVKQHQVIFMTCREEYIQMLGGNTIKL